MIAKLVTFADQAAYDRLIASNPLTDHEKGGVCVMLRQDIQNTRCQYGMRAVIEREGDKGSRVRSLKQDVREAPAEPADHGPGPEQGRNDDGTQAKEVRGSLTHDRRAAC